MCYIPNLRQMHPETLFDMSSGINVGALGLTGTFRHDLASNQWYQLVCFLSGFCS